MPMNENYAVTEPSRDEVNALAGATVIEFGAPWCGFCMRAQAPLAEAFGSHPDVRHIKVEDASGRPLGRSFRVKLWPTLVFMRDGQEVARLVRPSATAEIGKAMAELKAGAARADGAAPA